MQWVDTQTNFFTPCLYTIFTFSYVENCFSFIYFFVVVLKEKMLRKCRGFLIKKKHVFVLIYKRENKCHWIVFLKVQESLDSNPWGSDPMGKYGV